jgi:hypothetical protein
MIPIGNNYIDTHPDPTLAQIQYILTVLISRKERFGMVPGSEDYQHPSSEQASQQEEDGSRKNQEAEKGVEKISVWVDGMSKQSTLITANTTAQYLIEEIFPQVPRPSPMSLRNVRERCGSPKPRRPIKESLRVTRSE